jgi:hypothetical protein
MKKELEFRFMLMGVQTLVWALFYFPFLIFAYGKENNKDIDSFVNVMFGIGYLLSVLFTFIIPIIKSFINYIKQNP